MRDWYITETAIRQYMRLRGYHEHRYTQAREEIEALTALATLRQTDADGRELWRTPQAHMRLRMIVTPPRTPGDRPALAWLGQGAPPERFWRPSPVETGYPRTRPSRTRDDDE